MDNLENKSNLKPEYINFFEQADMDKIERMSAQFCNGYLILVDIKDSTSRKQEYKREWMLQTELVYKSFTKLVKEIEIRCKEDIKLINEKFLGDGGMAFFECQASQTSVSEEILSLV